MEEMLTTFIYQMLGVRAGLNGPILCYLWANLLSIVRHIAQA